MENQMDRNEVHIPKFIGKALACVLLLWMMIAIIVGLVEDALDSARIESDSFRVEMMERDYLERNIYQIYDTLLLYDLNDSCYDEYWEISEGYRDYLICVAYRNSEGTAGAELVDAERNGELAYDAFSQDLENCQSDRNRKLMNGWKTRLDQMEESVQ